MYRLIVLLLLCNSAQADYAAPQLEQAIEASCLVSAGDSRGSGCIYARDGDRILVITAAHVVGRSDRITLRIGRKGVQVTAKVIYKAAQVVRVINGRRFTVYSPADVAILEFSAKTVGKIRPIRPIRQSIPKGQAVYSLGFPGGGDMRLLTARTQGYDSDGHLLIFPGPELGRSGSAVIAHLNGEPRIIGIISTRQGTHTNGTPYWGDVEGRLVTPQMIWSNGPSALGPVYTQCDSNGCLDYMLPYRGDMDKRVQKLERSPGTVPLPPMAPPIDMEPINQRLNYIDNSIKEITDRSNVHSEAIGKLSLTAEKAVALADAVAKRDELFAADLEQVRNSASQAGQAAADAEDSAVEDALDEENSRGPLGRLRDRIHERIEDRVSGVKETLAGMIGLPTFLGGSGLGLGGIAIIIAAFALLRRGAINAANGDPTLMQRLAARTSNPYDDMAADAVARALAAIGSRLPSQRGKKADDEE